MDLRRLLVASGDQGLIEQITHSVDGRGFSIHAAYSHSDALYYLGSENFSLAIIDSRLLVRDTGEQSIAQLHSVHPRPPLLVVRDQDEIKSYADVADIELMSLEKEALRDAMLQALRIPKYDPTQIDTTSGFPSFTTNGTGTSIYWHDDEIRTLFALSRSLTEVLELSEVLNRVVEAARRLTHADEGMILLPDEHSTQLYLRAKVGIDANIAENFRIKTQDTVAGTVYTSAQPMLVSAQGPVKVKTEYFVNSLLYVPIMLNGQPLGVLGVNNRQKMDPFTDRHLDLLLNLASYASIAINNARVHGDSIRRTHELKSLVDASQAVSASLSLDRTLLAACEHLARILNVHSAEIYDVTTDRKQLVRRASFLQARWRTGAEPMLSLSPRDADLLASRSVAHIDVADSLDGDQLSMLMKAGATSAILLPVVHGDTLFGALIGYRAMPQEAKLSRSRIQRVQRVLAESAQVLVGGAGERTTSNAFHALADLRTMLDVERVEFGVTTQDGRSLRIRYSYGGMVWLGGSGGESLLDRGSKSFTFDDNYTFNYAIDDEGVSPTASLLMDASNGAGILGLPVKMRGQLLGLAVMVDTLRPRTFTRREIDLARAVIGQAGTAIDNAHLVIDLENSLRELKATQEKLIQAARLSAMGELAAAVAHQINNPLTTIVLDAELLLGDQQQGSLAYDSLSAILRAGKRASGVVRRLLSSARPGSENAAPVPVDVVNSLQETVSLVFPYFERAAIHLVIDLPDSPIPTVQAAPGSLDDVWLNLILNAHDVLVGRDHPRVDVNIEYIPHERIVEVTVSDNGPGIPDDVRPRIFDPFFTTKPHGEGTGLGLYICRQVIERVGGDLAVGASPNGGASFIVRLPSDT